MTQGYLLSVEGIDGAGKGTQLRLIETYLANRGIEYLFLREPGGTNIGEDIRSILLNPRNTEMTAITELLLFAAARAQLMEEVIRPALADGKLVLCDRFFDSTTAYQAGGRGLDRKMVDQSIRLATQGLVPDLTIYLDLDPEEARVRRLMREASDGSIEDRMEAEQFSFSIRVRDEYLALANVENRIHVVDAERTPEEIWCEIKEILDRCL